MRLTVAVCTWNRAGLLDRTLGHLAALRPPGEAWELVVVDNRSTDRTPAVLAGWAASGRLPLRADREEQQGHTHARNRALDLARGRWLLWTDDDVRPAPDWLKELAAATERHPHAAAVGGPVDPWFPTPPDPDLVAAFRPLAIGYCGVDHGPVERELLPHEEFYGANMGFNRAVVGGLRFDVARGRRAGHQGGGDDLEYLRRARAFGPAVWAPAARLAHYVLPERLTLGYVRRYVRDGVRPEDVYPDPGPTLFGAPRWLQRKRLGLMAGELAAAARGRRADRLRLMLARLDLETRLAYHRRHARHKGVPGG